MSKIVCDVCGTSYPETATQCPICGCVRPEESITYITEADSNEQQVSGSYTYVKGGRFSKSNVKKRNHGKTLPEAEPVPVPEKEAPAPGKGDKGFIIAIITLLLAIVAVVIYIAVRFFAPGMLPAGTSSDSTSGMTTEQTEGSTQPSETTEATIARIPCTDLVLSKTVIEFEKEGAALLLNVSLTPADTTDEVIFTTSDAAVAEVSEDGKVTAVGGGQAIITVTCGDLEAECRVVCGFETESTDPTDQTQPPVVSSDSFKLNREDFTLSKKGDTWKLYNGDIPVDQIAWTSDDEKVATIKDGVVTAVGGGYTTVHGEYQGMKVSCIVRCSFAPASDDDSVESSATASSLKISNTDVSIKVGETFTLTLVDENGTAVSVTWTAADSSVCSVDGNSITGVTAGSSTTVSADYQGTTYTCIVRVIA